MLILPGPPPPNTSVPVVPGQAPLPFWSTDNVAAVLEDGQVLLQSGRIARRSGSAQLRAGDPVMTVASPEGGLVAHQHAVRRAEFPPPAEVITGALEELIYVDRGAGDWDIYLRNDKQFTALKIKGRVAGTLPVKSSRPFMKWGEKKNTFAVKTITVLPSGGGLAGGASYPNAPINLPTFYVFTLNREPTHGLGTTPAKASLTKVRPCPQFVTQYRFQRTDVLPEQTIVVDYPITFPEATNRLDEAQVASEVDFYLTADLDVVALSTIGEFFYFNSDALGIESYWVEHPMVVSCATGAILYDHAYDQQGHRGPNTNTGIFGAFGFGPPPSLISWSKAKPARCILITPFQFSTYFEGGLFDTASGQRALYLQGPSFQRLYLYPLEAAIVEPGSTQPGVAAFYPMHIAPLLGNVNDEHFLWTLTSWLTRFAGTTPVTETLHIVTPAVRADVVVATAAYDLVTAQASPIGFRALRTYARAFQALSLTTLFCIDEADESNDQYGPLVNLPRLWPLPAKRKKFLRAFDSHGAVVPGFALGPADDLPVDSAKNRQTKLKTYPPALLPHTPVPGQADLYHLLTG